MKNNEDGGVLTLQGRTISIGEIVSAYCLCVGTQRPKLTTERSNETKLFRSYTEIVLRFDALRNEELACIFEHRTNIIKKQTKKNPTLSYKD